jgi:hypothetical protein
MGSISMRYQSTLIGALSSERIAYKRPKRPPSLPLTSIPFLNPLVSLD